jgi:hypothetical protein
MRTETDEGIIRAVAAANAIYDLPRATPGYEPVGAEEIDAGIRTLAQRSKDGGGTLTEIIENARAAAEVLSDDPFQALSEIIQNADDAAATRVRIRLVDDDLLVVHDGRPLRLQDAHALAAPWLTTKREDATAVGRFGIGLMTLYALADHFEMHSGGYHVRFGTPTLDVVPALSDDLAIPAETVLVVPLREPADAQDRLLEWASRWDDTALLFLRSVGRVEFTAGDEMRSLELSWLSRGDVDREIDGTRVTVRRRTASAADGRRWVVDESELPSPLGVHRAHKATGATTPVAVALSVFGEDEGMLYAGLPVAPIALPVRVNAQFDPIASRQGVATNAWNRSLIPLVADLWTHAVLELFRENAPAAWGVVPIGSEAQLHQPVLADLGEALIEASRSSVALDLDFDIDGDRHWIGDLAHEVPVLEGRISSGELARLASVEAALPSEERDGSGRWRTVLADWRAAGVEVQAPVTVADALRLLDDPEIAPDRVIDLTATALAEGLDLQVASTKCVVLDDGTLTVPPSAQSLSFLVTARSGLAVTLGLGRALHEAHGVDDPAARSVLAWLEGRGSILGGDARAVLTRLSQAGRSGQRLSGRLEDSQLVALRDAIESLGQADWTALTPAIGRAIRVEGFQYGSRGRTTVVDVAPTAAYLGRSIDKEPDSFAVAADETPGITWVAPRYANVLRSSLGRQGLGALRFLRLLGVENAPRLSPHPSLVRKYVSPRGGLAAWHGGLQERSRAITAIGGEYTLDDQHSPDLDRVLQHIGADRKVTRRRIRASALIATLGRAWGSLGEQAEVTAVTAYQTWNRVGDVRSWWVWKAATTPWLDDDTGSPHRPLDLRLRTPATLAVHGEDPTGYLHRSFRSARTDVLEALGVGGEPSTADLCVKLRELRDGGAEIDEDVANVIYKAVADRLGTSSHLRGDLTQAQLRKAFADGAGLVLTKLGWRQPAEVLAGKPIFADRRPFTPAIGGAEPLWRALNIRLPRTDDCIRVLKEIGDGASAPDPTTQTVLLETSRELARLVQERRPSDSEMRRLSRLPLWTTSGWTDKRPVYAVHDPVLASGLAEVVPVWRPGGEVVQFAVLLRPLRLTEVPASAGEVIGAPVEADEDLTDLFKKAVRLLHEDLVRNDPSTASALRVSWTTFDQYDVVVAPQLSVRVPQVKTAKGAAVVSVNAKADAASRCVYVTDGDLLGRLDGGGRAVAGLFDADHRRVAQAWLAAMEGATAERQATDLKLAEERAEEEQRRIDESIERQTLGLQRQATTRRAASKTTATPKTVPPPTVPSPAASSAPRLLVDPSQLRVVDPGGEITGTSSPPAPSPGGTSPPLREPSATGSAPRSRSAARGYTDLEKETIGLQLARRVLESDEQDMVDLRAERGVGADAMDDLRQFFELKVYAGPEPDEIRLTDAEVRRAMSGDDFFLVVVSGVEAGSVEHKVRVIAQPLAQLQKRDHREMRLGGIRSARSLVYNLAPLDEG